MSTNTEASDTEAAAAPECPNCGKTLVTRASREMVDEERYVVVRWHFCPHCGWTNRGD